MPLDACSVFLTTHGETMRFHFFCLPRQNLTPATKSVDGTKIFHTPNTLVGTIGITHTQIHTSNGTTPDKTSIPLASKRGKRHHMRKHLPVSILTFCAMAPSIGCCCGRPVPNGQKRVDVAPILGDERKWRMTFTACPEPRTSTKSRRLPRDGKAKMPVWPCSASVAQVRKTGIAQKIHSNIGRAPSTGNVPGHTAKSLWFPSLG